MSKRVNGFSISEALITLLIMSIILAALIPVVSKKQSLADSGWSYVSSGSGANSDLFYGLGVSQTAIIGASSRPPSSDKSKLSIVAPLDEDNDTITRPIIDFAQKTAFGMQNIGKISFDQKDNSAFGRNALQNNNYGTNNAAIGSGALTNNLSGSRNTAVGFETLANNTIGNNNLAIGYQACNGVDGNGNICVGYRSGGSTGDNQLFIDNQSNGPASLIYGDFSGRTVKINGVLSTAYGTLSGPSDIRLKNLKGNSTDGIEKIDQIQVKKFTFKKDKTQKVRVGVIAQEIKAIFPNSVELGEDGYLSLETNEIFYAMLNSIKYLNKEIKKLKIENNSLKVQNEELKYELSNINKRLDKLEKKTK